MKYSILFFSFVVCFLFFVICPIGMPSAQAQTQFQEVIGGTNNDDASTIIQTTDGGYAIAGGTDSFGPSGYYFYLVKLNGSGNLLWSKTYGGISSVGANSMVQTTDGGYVMAGTSGNPGPVFNDTYVVRVASTGNLLWSKAIGGRGNNIPYSIVQTSDGGYAVAGWTDISGSEDFLILKLDANGNLQWCRSIGSTGTEYAYSIIQTSDGGYAVAGETNSFGAGGYDMYIVKLDAGGNLQWNRTVGGPGFDDASSIIQTSDGGYAVAGGTESFGAGNGDMYIVKLDAGGSLQWTRTVGGTGWDGAKSIVQTTDGGYAVAGLFNGLVAGGDMYIVKLNNSGALLWSRTVGGTQEERALSIIQTSDGGYAATGPTRSFGSGNDDIFVVKFDANGNTCGNMISLSSLYSSGGTLGSPTSYIYSRTPFDSSLTWTTGTGGTLTTICSNIGIQPISNEIPASYELYQNYPNPFNPTTKIKFSVPFNKGGDRGLSTQLKIYDILGREATTLVNEQLKPGTYEVEWDASIYPSGVYFYKLTAGDFTETKKMVLIK
jgi:Secretion system C-terminal sorting domain/Domain of unknown function (DUF5122) beta-propeller